MPSAVLVHDHFTGPTGMGLVVGRHARWLLEAGWHVTLVGDNVPAELGEACVVRSAPAPRGLPSHLEHLVWCRRARRALGDLDPDVIHVHSPLLAPVADLLTSHFISRPAHDRGAREMHSGVDGAMRRAQATLSRRADDRAYRSARQRTYVSFVSEFLRDEFERCYGPPQGGWVLPPPAPAWNPVSADERRRARARFGVAEHTTCVGYLGGSDPRKGFSRLEPLRGDSGLTLLVAGAGSEGMTIAGARGLGFVAVDEFHAACDVVAAPAVFDSAPVAVLQAIARDVPVLTTPQCGWAGSIARHEAGVVWTGDEPIGAGLRRASHCGAAGRQAFLREFSEPKLAAELRSAYGQVASGAVSR